jgi:hypothetical protein
MPRSLNHWYPRPEPGNFSIHSRKARSAVKTGIRGWKMLAMSGPE